MTSASSTPVPSTTRQLQSTVTSDAQLTLRIVEVPVPAPGPDDVVVRVDAAPINPSDLGLLLATADPATFAATSDGSAAPIPPKTLDGMRTRLDEAMPVGNEGAGVVIAAGSSDAAQALMGRVVSVIGGATYTQHRTVNVSQCLAMPEGVTAREAASHFVNPMTVLAMIETMRREKHTAIVHTAAASNLGQMLIKACKAEGIGLVNVVRRPEHVAQLRALGAEHVVDSSAPTFHTDLTAALQATGATVAFDATGGGTLASSLLSCMEAAINASATTFNRYGSNVHKQVYICGGLDTRPLELHRNYGMAWGLGGWLLTPRLIEFGGETMVNMRAQVAREITTTFASSYSDEITLDQVIAPETIVAYAAKATGAKYLITPNA